MLGSRPSLATGCWRNPAGTPLPVSISFILAIMHLLTRPLSRVVETRGGRSSSIKILGLPHTLAPDLLPGTRDWYSPPEHTHPDHPRRLYPYASAIFGEAIHRCRIPPEPATEPPTLDGTWHTRTTLPPYLAPHPHTLTTSCHTLRTLPPPSAPLPCDLLRPFIFRVSTSRCKWETQFGSDSRRTAYEPTCYLNKPFFPWPVLLGHHPTILGTPSTLPYITVGDVLL
jgi:hypothetical protein